MNFENRAYHNSTGTEASSSEPCLFCNRPQYCFHIKDDRGEIYKILCDRTDANNPLEGWRHVGTATDGRNIFAKLGYKSCRKRGKRYPEVIELNPQTRVDIPQWQDVHIPVEQAERGHAVLIKPELGLGSPNTVYEIQELKPGKRQGKNTLIAILTIKGSPYGGKLEIVASDIAEVLTRDPVTGAKEQFIEYQYSEDFKTVRYQWTDRRAVYGDKTKQVRPYHRGTDGSWILGKGDRQPLLYHLVEAEETIQAGGIVFAAGGEQAVEYLRSLGLTSVCNQGGENGYRQIAKDLALPFKEAAEFHQLLEVDAEDGLDVDVAGRRPLLVLWPDNDETGRKTFGEALLKECYKNGVTSVVINPLTLWPDMPPGGDAKDWIDHCKKSGIPSSEMIRSLEFAIDDAIDQHEEEIRLRWQREAWDAPVSHKGEIGRWVQKGEGENTKKDWKPLCNFDFQVERELKDSSGGGMVLQIKRSFENQQYRIVLKSTDYTKVDTFVDALKAAMGTGIVCNLSKQELGSLIHTRLHEYRTNRQGKIYKRIERYGQQPDGVWVFRDRQYTSDGQLTSEAETGWVFSNVSSEGDDIPCPELAPENPKTLKALVNAARHFFGIENFYQVILMMGWVVAGLHSQSIFKEKRWFPLLNAYGEPGSCKTLAGEAALSLIGINWGEKGMLARSSPSAIYEHGSKTGALPFIWDDPPRNPESEEIAKTWANWKARVVRFNRQEPHSPMALTSNHVSGGDQAATYTRLIRLPFERATSGANSSFQKLQVAQSAASGAFPTLLKIGYPMEAIAAIELELLNHLPKAHARIAQALAIVVFYAQKIVDLAEGTQDVKRWVINHLCPSEDDADSAGDSLQDFIEKIITLESQSLVGDWNKQIVTTRDGSQWVALHYADVWALVDQRFKPATYNQKALKPLVLKVGGKVDSKQKFDVSSHETKRYHELLLLPHYDREGNPIPVLPPRKVARNAWLLPISLFGGSDGGGGGGDYNPTPPDDDTAPTSSLSSSSSNEFQKNWNSQNRDITSTLEVSESQVPKFQEKEDLNLSLVEISSNSASDDGDCNISEKTGTFGTSGTQFEKIAETSPVKEFQQVPIETELDGNFQIERNSPPELPQTVNSSPAIAPPEPAQPAAAPAAAEVEAKFKVGDAVAHSDSYMVAYTFHGVVEQVEGNEILVRWAERQGKANECERYHASELRRLE